MTTPLEKAKTFFKNDYQYLLEIENSNEPLSPDQIDRIINKIDSLMKEKGKDITSNQLRNIFSRIKRLGSQDITKLKLLRPKIAYITGRQTNWDAQIVTELISDLIKQIDHDSSKAAYQIKSLQTIMEAMVGYQKFHYPKK